MKTVWLLLCFLANTIGSAQSISQGCFCSAHFTYCYTEIEITDQTCPSHSIPVYLQHADEPKHLPSNTSYMVDYPLDCPSVIGITWVEFEHQGPASWRLTTVKWWQFSQSNCHYTIGARQTEYHEALPSSANMQSHLTSSFTNNGNASWYSVCRVPIVEWWLDCEDCHHLTVIGLHNTGLRSPNTWGRCFSSLPFSPCHMASSSSFKSALKTHLFNNLRVTTFIIHQWTGMHAHVFVLMCLRMLYIVFVLFCILSMIIEHLPYPSILTCSSFFPWRP